MVDWFTALLCRINTQSQIALQASLPDILIERLRPEGHFNQLFVAIVVVRARIYYSVYRHTIFYYLIQVPLRHQRRVPAGAQVFVETGQLLHILAIKIKVKDVDILLNSLWCN